MSTLEENYVKVVEMEVATERMDHALLEKAMVDANGNLKEATALYVKYRLEELIQKEKQATEEAKETIRQLGRMVDKEQAALAKREGNETNPVRAECPKCGFLCEMPAASCTPQLKCPKCYTKLVW